ncbi:MAG: hypothetical protein JRI41_01425 [Deltaproteobacteria bacterium]|nr:hypothetical protein [Deltaproteobacteria bacterium]
MLNCSVNGWGIRLLLGVMCQDGLGWMHPGRCLPLPERSDGGQVIVRGIEKRRIDDVRRHRDKSGSIGTMFSHDSATRERMPEARMASTLRRGIPEKSNAELAGGGLAIIRRVSK